MVGFDVSSQVPLLGRWAELQLQYSDDVDLLKTS